MADEVSGGNVPLDDATIARCKAESASLREYAKANHKVCGFLVDAATAAMANQAAIPNVSVQWSRPVSKKDLAKILGCRVAKKAEWVNHCVKDGTLRIKQSGRQSVLVDLACIPENLRDTLRVH